MSVKLSQTKVVASATMVLCFYCAAAPASEPATASVQTVASRIDELIAARWKEHDIEPGEVADDAEFLRRAHLDIAGRIPSASQVRKFLGNTDPNKRRTAIDDLLNSPTYNTHFTTVWRNALIPEAATDPLSRQLVPGFEAWVWQKMFDNTRYDEFVREIITTPINPRIAQATTDNTKPTPFAFYQAKQIAPENLAAATSRVFLGVRLECAQCHDHPFDTWTQDQFWSYAAFFSGLTTASRDNPNPREDPKLREIKIPETDKVVPAVFLNGNKPDFADRSTRETLSDWLTARDNEFFAKMAVNRVWGHLFGRGIVEPVDDFTADNPPSHPKLLDELARQFVAHDFDLKFMLRAITATKTYQLSSQQTHASQSEPQFFARMALKGLTPEQLFDSLAEATGFYQPYRSENPFVLQQDTPRSEYLRLFRDESNATTERETTILQALAMMNGEFIADATSLDDSQTLTAITEFPLMSNKDRLESLFLAALSRRPSSAESKRMLEFIQQTTADSSEKDTAAKTAFADIFWAMLNSSEFLFNH